MAGRIKGASSLPFSGFGLLFVCLGEILLGSGAQHVRATTYRPPIGVELSQSFPTKQDKKRHIEDDLHEASYLLVVVVVVSGE